jgi:hypothetical protein
MDRSWRQLLDLLEFTRAILRLHSYRGAIEILKEVVGRTLRLD